MPRRYPVRAARILPRAGPGGPLVGPGPSGRAVRPGAAFDVKIRRSEAVSEYCSAQLMRVPVLSAVVDGSDPS